MMSGTSSERSVEWTPARLGVFKREHAAAMSRRASEFTSEVPATDGGATHWNTKYAGYLIEYLENVAGIRPG